MSRNTGVVKVAYGSVPKDSGTFTFYKTMRPRLMEHGIELICVSLGVENAQLWQSNYSDDGCVLLAPRTVSLKRQAKVFVNWCSDEGVDIVMGINSPGILCAVPHLPEEVRVIARCANAFDEGYRVTMIGRERLAQIVALSPKLEKDLVQSYGANSKAIRLIPNGVDVERFAYRETTNTCVAQRLELGFLGRLEHGQKGVLDLPLIVARLIEHGVNFRLRIAGKGKHEKRLLAELAEARQRGYVEFLGPLSHAEVPKFLQSIDMFLFTSRFEGMPNALLEAMAVGALPVCFNIEGITDFMLEDGKSGYLVEQGDIHGFCDRICAISKDRDRLMQMRHAVAMETRRRFSREATALKYASLFHEVVDEPPPRWEPTSWSDFSADSIFSVSWRSYVPVRIKNLLKAMLDA